MQPRSGFREDSRWAVNFFCQSECRELKDILFLKFICCALAALQQPSLHVEWSQLMTYFPLLCEKASYVHLVWGQTANQEIVSQRIDQSSLMYININ